jgi:four helix bundle protein
METGKFKFDDLIIWQKAVDCGEEIFQLSRQFLKEEIYNLTSRVCRAADSVALQISEGSTSRSNPEQERFIGLAVRSLAEEGTCLYKAKRRNYISEPDSLIK